MTPPVEPVAPGHSTAPETPLRSLARDVRLRRLLLWSYLARVPLGVLTLALFLGVQADSGSLRFAGTVSAAAVVGLAVSAPTQGWLLDRRGAPGVLGAFAAAHAGSLVLLAAVPLAAWPRWAVLLLALVTGATVPALTSCTRLALRRSVPGARVDTVFGIDAVLLEVVYLAGPAAAAGAVAGFGLRPVLTGCAVLTVLGTAAFCRAAAPAGLRVDGGAASEDGPPTSSKVCDAAPAGVSALGCFVLGMTLLALPFGVMEAALAQRAVEAGESSASVGVLLTVMGVGGVVGGSLHSLFPGRGAPQVRFVAVAAGFGAGLSACALLSGPVAVGVAVLAAGLCATPLAALSFRMLDLISPPGAWMQAQGWGAVANTAGHAAGLSAAAHVAATQGASVAFVLIAPAVLAGLLLSAPVLRGRRTKARTVG
ncbi:hypothetical protein ACWGBV_01005 [Streptomyces sp. NPDC055051]